MSIQIRKATVSDCPQMMELIRELAVFERAPNEVTVSPDHFVDAGFGNNPVWDALVAVDGERIVGLSLWYIRYSTWKGRRFYLEDLIVTESYRGTGIGKLLFDESVAIAKEMNVSGMMWQVLEWNEPAIKFYEKYGAKLDGEWVNCSLEF